MSSHVHLQNPVIRKAAQRAHHPNWGKHMDRAFVDGRRRSCTPSSPPIYHLCKCWDYDCSL